MGKHRLIVAEDHVIMREGLCSLLESTDLYEVVGQAVDGLEAIELAENTLPDLMILDISMPKLNGLSVIHDLKSRYPEIKIIVLTVHDTEEYLKEIFRAGANGYCLKKGAFNELLTAIDNVLNGKPYVSPHITQPLLDNYLKSNIREKSVSSGWDVLTQREKEILKLVGEGYKNKSIAELLCISPKTVEKHRSNLMAKLNLHNSSSLTAYAIKMGLVLPPA
ncbi:MAG: response regulator transcription factor [Desulforhopalus sp.]